MTHLQQHFLGTPLIWQTPSRTPQHTSHHRPSIVPRAKLGEAVRDTFTGATRVSSHLAFFQLFGGLHIAPPFWNQLRNTLDTLPARLPGDDPSLGDVVLRPFGGGLCAALGGTIAHSVGTQLDGAAAAGLGALAILGGVQALRLIACTINPDLYQRARYELFVAASKTIRDPLSQLRDEITICRREREAARQREQNKLTVIFAEKDSSDQVTAPSTFDSAAWNRYAPKKEQAEQLLFDAQDPAAAVRAAILADPVLAADALEQAKGLWARNYDNPILARERFKHVPFMRGGRDVYVTALSEIMLARSRRLKDQIRADSARAAWDRIVIGSGPHGFAAADEMRKAGRSVLLIDAGDGFSANFKDAGQCFRLNSANRSDDNAPAQLGSGTGNINPLAGPVQVPDVTADNWPLASVISQVGAVNLYDSGLPVVFASVAKKISLSTSAERYTIRVFDRDASEPTLQYFQVRTNSIYIATGLGELKVPLANNRGGTLLNAINTRARADMARPPRQVRADLASRDPGVRSVREAFEIGANQRDPLAPYREPWALIGFGDSAKTFAQWAFQLAEGAYDTPGNGNVAQQGAVLGCTWFVGTRGPRDCREYSATSRGRYADLAAPLNRKVVLVPAQLEKLTPRLLGKGYALSYRIPGQAALQRVFVKRVVVATGYDNQVGTLLPDFLLRINRDTRAKPQEFATQVFELALDKPTGEIVTQRRTFNSVCLGRAVRGQAIYLVGPAAGPDIVPRESEAGVAENAASLANLLSRTQRLARLTADTTPPDFREPPDPTSPFGGDRGARGVGYPFTAAPQPTLQLTACAGMQSTTKLTSSSRCTLPLEPNAQLMVLAMLQAALLSTRVGQIPVELLLVQTRDGLMLTANLSRKTLAQVAERIRLFPELLDRLAGFVSARRRPLQLMLSTDSQAQVTVVN